MGQAKASHLCMAPMAYYFCRVLEGIRYDSEDWLQLEGNDFSEVAEK